MKIEQNTQIFNLTVTDLEVLIEKVVDKLLRQLKPKEQNSRINNRLISFKDVLEVFSISKPTARSWEKYGHLPRSIKIGGKLYYYRDEIEKLFKNNV